jgi:hypothetical protein
MVRTLRRLEDPELTAQRQTASLAALAVTLGLVVGGLYLVQTLRTLADQQDCLLTGRATCVILAGR